MWFPWISAARNKTAGAAGAAMLALFATTGQAAAQSGPADTLRYPYVAALSRVSGDARVYFCTGTLIAPRWIVTAAHCFHDPRGRRIDDGDLWAQVGGSRLADVPDEAQVRFDRIFLHPDYDPESQANDIALVRLDEEAGPLIATVAQGYGGGDGEDAVMLGFGSYYEGLLAGRATARDGRPLAQLSNALRQARVPLVDPAECAAALGLGGEATGTYQLCAGGPGAAGRGACLGDSGGPLVAGRDEAGDRLVGLVSFGSGCGAAAPLMVYTRISAYARWIGEVIAGR
jgi:secreted trypsin-like serine protease